MIDQPLAVEWTAQDQADYITSNVYTGGYRGPAALPGEPEIASAMLQARNEDAANALKGRETKATFKLKSMTREFSTPYDIQVTDVKVPTGYNLEAV